MEVLVNNNVIPKQEEYKTLWSFCEENKINLYFTAVNVANKAELIV